MDSTALYSMTPTALAFVGDAAYSLYVRRRLAERSDRITGTMHVVATRFVNARAQAETFDALISSNMLNERESEIAHRAKNAHLHSRSKTASPSEYHKATALEAVIGYVYMSDDTARLDILLEKLAELSGLNEYLRVPVNAQ